MRCISTIVMIGLLSGGVVLTTFTPPLALAEVSTETLIETARTKAAHEAIAAHYEQDAATLRAKAEEHARLALLYARGLEGGHGQGERLSEHCQGLAEKLRAAAEDSIELARLHRELAAQSAQ